MTTAYASLDLGRLDFDCGRARLGVGRPFAPVDGVGRFFGGVTRLLVNCGAAAGSVGDFPDDPLPDAGAFLPVEFLPVFEPASFESDGSRFG